MNLRKTLFVSFANLAVSIGSLAASSAFAQAGDVASSIALSDCGTTGTRDWH